MVKSVKTKRSIVGDVTMDALFQYEQIGHGSFILGKNRLTLL